MYPSVCLSSLPCCPESGLYPWSCFKDSAQNTIKYFITVIRKVNNAWVKIHGVPLVKVRKRWYASSEVSILCNTYGLETRNKLIFQINELLIISLKCWKNETVYLCDRPRNLFVSYVIYKNCNQNVNKQRKYTVSV